VSRDAADWLTAPRTLGYWMLRLQERLGLSPAEFVAASRREQLSWLGYELLREAETAAVADFSFNTGD
jgi:hypothetical protein